MPGLRVARTGPELAWRAADGDEVLGSVRAWVRPDQRCALFFGECRADAYDPLLTAVSAELRRDLYVWADEADTANLARYAELGFQVARRESDYLIPADPAVTGLAGATVPAGLAVISAGSADVDRLRLLDDELRQDVPGADGWRWDAAGFRAETFSPAFDPATYLVAVAEDTGGYAGLARVWNDPDGPRLGLIAVLAPYRRRGLARALLGQAFGVLHERGQAGATAEVDDTNVASTALLTGLGARRTGGSVELIRRATLVR